MQVLNLQAQPIIQQLTVLPQYILHLIVHIPHIHRQHHIILHNKCVLLVIVPAECVQHLHKVQCSLHQIYFDVDLFSGLQLVGLGVLVGEVVVAFLQIECVLRDHFAAHDLVELVVGLVGGADAEQQLQDWFGLEYLGQIASMQEHKHFKIPDGIEIRVKHPGNFVDAIGELSEHMHQQMNPILDILILFDILSEHLPDSLRHRSNNTDELRTQFELYYSTVIHAKYYIILIFLLHLPNQLVQFDEPIWWVEILYPLISQQAQSIMKSKLLYLVCGTVLGAGGHYAYRYYNPQRNISSATQEIVSAFISHHKLQQGYVISVLKSVGLMLKGFYHYGMDTKIRGFNYNSTYLRKDELTHPDEQIKHLYCIFSPTEYICGHPEIQHGGATATIIDQNMGYLAMLHSKNNVATYDLHVRYKRPVKKDQYYVLEVRVTESKGRKIWIKGVIKQLQTGEVKVESEGLFYTVDWDNQMSRIITKFFKAINFKDYSESHQDGLNIHHEYKQAQLQANNPHKTHHEHKSQQTKSRQSTGRQSLKSSGRQGKLEQIRTLKQSLLNRGKEGQEYDSQIQKLTALVQKLEKSQNLISIPPAQKTDQNSATDTTNNPKSELIS